MGAQRHPVSSAAVPPDQTRFRYSWVRVFSRQLFFAIQRVAAARMALGFRAVFVAASLVLAMIAPPESGRFGQAALAAGGFGGVMCVVAFGLLRKAERRVATLQARRSELEAHARGIR